FPRGPFCRRDPMNIRARWLVLAAALPLLYLPLRAAEAPPPEAAAEDAATPPAADASETDVPLPPPDLDETAAAPPRPAADAERDAAERLSLADTLRFPVDI